jgi:hypothetical protein
MRPIFAAAEKLHQLARTRNIQQPFVSALPTANRFDLVKSDLSIKSDQDTAV